MNRYKITKQLGDGTYGSVLKGVNRQTGEVVRFVHVKLIPMGASPSLNRSQLRR
jgi:serine/threonine protein kinase